MIKQGECVRTYYVFWLLDVIVSFVIKPNIISNARDFIVNIVNKIEMTVTLISLPLKSNRVNAYAGVRPLQDDNQHECLPITVDLLRALKGQLPTTPMKNNACYGLPSLQLSMAS